MRASQVAQRLRWLFGVMVFASCSLTLTVASAEKVPTGSQTDEVKLERASLNIDKLGTKEAEPKAEAALLKVPGVTKAKVSYPKQTAFVEYDPAKVNIGRLVAALQAVGFPASPTQARYICPTCQGTYQAAGTCLICQATLQPIKPEKAKPAQKKAKQ